MAGWRRLVLASALFLGLVGCTPSTVAPVTDIPAAAKTVVIVPSLPGDLIVATRGFTVFGNNLDQPSIADWNLEQVVYHAAAAALTPKYQVSEAVPSNALVDYQSRLNADLDGDDGVAELVKSHVDVTPAPDLYVVFCVSARSDPYTGATPSTPYFMEDIGISYALPPWGLPPPMPPAIHSFMEMTVIDGKTMKVISDSPLIMAPGSNVRVGVFGSRDDPYPERFLKGFEWHDHWADMTPDEQAEIRSGIEDLLTNSVGYTVKTALGGP